MTPREITYLSGGVECAGDLYVHEGEPRPGIVICHGFNMTKEALVPEGRALHAAGFNVLAVDYRNFGKSKGAQRGALFPRDEVEDVRNAITFLRRCPEVDADRIAILGVSFGGGIVLQTAAFDRRVKAVVAVVPIVNGRRWMRDMRGGDDFERLRAMIDADFEGRYGDPSAAVKIPSSGPRNQNPAIPMVRVEGMDIEPNPDNPNYVAYPDAYQETYDPMILLESVERVIDFNPSDVIDMIAPRPLMIIANGGYDQCHFLTHIQDAFAKAGEPKKLVILPYHVAGLYQEPGRAEALSHAVPFLQSAL